MVHQTGGGSIGQSLRYLDPAAPEQTGPAGTDLLIERGLIARPAIGGGTRKRKGGFFPSVMGGVVNAGVVSGPLVAFAARKLLTRKNRRGGSRKGNRWMALKEEAKAILQTHGKPTAINIQKYAAAKRKGTELAEEFLEQYRKTKQEKAEANEAKKRVKAAEKEEKKREREAKKAIKTKTKKTKAPTETKPKQSRKGKAKPVAPKPKGTHLFFNNEGRVIERTEERARVLNSLAQRVGGPKTPNRPKTPPVAEAKTRKSPSNKSKTYFAKLKEAREFLSTVGAPTGPNMAKYASMMIKGENSSEWLENFKTRRPLTMAKTKKAPKSTAVKPNSPPKRTVAAAEAKTRKSPSNKSKVYFSKLKEAREFLTTVGAPTGPNMAKYASMMMKGENTSEWLEKFKSRRPKTAATAKAPRKAKAKTEKKVLTAVKEENENNMQGYSENFESEE